MSQPQNNHIASNLLNSAPVSKELRRSIDSIKNAVPATEAQVQAMHSAGVFQEFFSVGASRDQDITIEGDTVLLSPAGFDKEDFILDGIILEFNGEHFMVNTKLAPEEGSN